MACPTFPDRHPTCHPMDLRSMVRAQRSYPGRRWTGSCFSDKSKTDGGFRVTSASYGTDPTPKAILEQQSTERTHAGKHGGIALAVDVAVEGVCDPHSSDYACGHHSTRSGISDAACGHQCRNQEDAPTEIPISVIERRGCVSTWLNRPQIPPVWSLQGSGVRGGTPCEYALPKLSRPRFDARWLSPLCGTRVCGCCVPSKHGAELQPLKVS